MRDLAELDIRQVDTGTQRPAPSSEAVVAFEHHFGVKIPKDYLKLLRHSNGDWIGANAVPSGVWSVGRFFYLDDDRKSLEGLWRHMAVWRRIVGDRYLPFADDGFGNVFMFDLATSPPKVVVCDHEESYAIIDLAPSFEAFVDSLVRYDNDD